MEKYFQEFKFHDPAIEVAFFLSGYRLVEQFELLYDENKLMAAVKQLEDKVKNLFLTFNFIFHSKTTFFIIKIDSNTC
jgi:hypothetical protein